MKPYPGPDLKKYSEEKEFPKKNNLNSHYLHRIQIYIYFSEINEANVQ